MSIASPFVSDRFLRPALRTRSEGGGGCSDHFGCAAAANIFGGTLSAPEYFCFAAFTQVLKSLSLTTRTEIGMNAWFLPHSSEHWPWNKPSLVALNQVSLRRPGTASILMPNDGTVKATGKQWFWSYSYPDNGNFEFNSLIVAKKDLKPDQPRLLTVDNELVVPVNKIVHVLVTGADVIHSFAVPSFGIKIDAVPGRLNETWFKATSEGLFHGQCSELCGKNHAFMPITVRVVSESDFATWVAAAKQKFAATAPTTLAAADPRGTDVLIQDGAHDLRPMMSGR